MHNPSECIVRFVVASIACSGTLRDIFLTHHTTVQEELDQRTTGLSWPNAPGQVRLVTSSLPLPSLELL